jgi:thiol-disulfide isomerase/thioredoxin
VRGHPVNLADFKGRVVLVDFWATWCGPCVGEMPNVIATYNRYHGQGFDIIGISLDRDHDALTGFLDHNQVTWDILFDSGGWQNAWAQQFHIHSIPNTFLIGKDGRLIAHGLRGPALAPAVAAALGIAP